MRSSEHMSLPLSQPQYDQSNEQLMRRTIEQYMQELRNDIQNTQNNKDKEASTGKRRFQFLLMGAANG
jgi:hypothetical protein